MLKKTKQQKKLEKETDDLETTNQFADIIKQYTDPLEIEKIKLIKRREEIKRDKNYGFN